MNDQPMLSADAPSEQGAAGARCSLAKGSASLYAAPYINEIRLSVRRMTRREIRRLMTIRHGQRIPPDVNLRNYVSKFQAHQQAINGGAVPSDFWRAAVGLPNKVDMAKRKPCVFLLTSKARLGSNSVGSGERSTTVRAPPSAKGETTAPMQLGIG